ncbi:MAG: glycosyltransferase family 4 protein [Candidatus Nanoarchaeia archaeon]|nr:glycosyltransferase family 4 protein [Candidatus Haiyanarchaeum thermophilum]
MKILMVYPWSKGAGGVEVWIQEVGKRLREMGHEVIIADKEISPYLWKKVYMWFFYQPPKDVDIIHLHDFSLFPITSGKPIISTYHGAAWCRFRVLGQVRPFFSGLLEKIRYSLSDINVVVSREVQRWYPRSIYIPNGTDIKRFNPRNKKLFDLPSSHINCVYVGRLAYDKGYFELLKLRKKARRHKIKIYISMQDFGYIDSKLLPNLYTSFDVFVLASLYEGAPLAALEAMASGLPVVAYRTGGMPDIVFDGFNGYLVDIGDTEDFIEKIKLAYENREYLGRNGRKLCEQIFNWEYVTKRYEKLYQKLLESKAS